MKRRPWRFTPPRAPGAPLAGTPEMAAEAEAGGGALNGEHVVEIARWYLPEAMLRHEGGAEPENVRILRARGDSMKPAVHDETGSWSTPAARPPPPARWPHSGTAADSWSSASRTSPGSTRPGSA